MMDGFRLLAVAVIVLGVLCIGLFIALVAMVVA